MADATFRDAAGVPGGLYCRAMALSPRTRSFALALCGWTLFTWVTRVPLLLGDHALSAGGKVLALLPVLVFVLGAAATATAVVRRLDSAGQAVLALAAWSTLYWPVRLAFVLTNDHKVGFYVVHALLGIVAVTLSVLAARGALADGTSPTRPRPRSLA